MQITVTRKWFTGNDTTGELTIDGSDFHCFTLEDTVRDPGVKVAGETAIPAGTYDVVVDLSNRFKRFMPHVLGVPGFDGIRIHSGNTNEDTEGCILLGTERGTMDGENAVLNSRVAFGDFFGILANGAGNAVKEPTKITIVDDKSWNE